MVACGPVAYELYRLSANTLANAYGYLLGCYVLVRVYVVCVYIYMYIYIYIHIFAYIYTYICMCVCVCVCVHVDEDGTRQCVWLVVLVAVVVRVRRWRRVTSVPLLSDRAIEKFPRFFARDVPSGAN